MRHQGACRRNDAVQALWGRTEGRCCRRAFLLRLNASQSGMLAQEEDTVMMSDPSSCRSNPENPGWPSMYAERAFQADKNASFASTGTTNLCLFVNAAERLDLEGASSSPAEFAAAGADSVACARTHAKDCHNYIHTYS
jgi:hypothetical protein